MSNEFPISLGLRRVTPLTKFFDAIAEGDIAEVNKALENGIGVNTIYEETSPLMQAVFHQKYHIISLFIDKGANVLYRDSYGNNAIISAIYDLNDEGVLGLLNHVSDVNAISKLSGQTALAIAVQEYRTAIVKRLLVMGASVDQADDDGNTALMFAARGDDDTLRSGEVEIINLLLEHGADVNLRNGVGWTPLRFAVLYSDVNVVKTILARGADINTKANDGSTPLMAAIDYKNEDVALYLIDQGARLEEKNILGRTALEVGKSKGNERIVKYIEDKQRAK